MDTQRPWPVGAPAPPVAAVPVAAAATIVAAGESRRGPWRQQRRGELPRLTQHGADNPRRWWRAHRPPSRRTAATNTTAATAVAATAAID